MSYQVIRPQIVTLLQTISTIQEVAMTPKIEFSGYPAAHVVPSDNTNDYQTNQENERIYSWFIRCFEETKIQGIEKAYQSLEQVVDSIVDLFDLENEKGGSDRTIGVSLPARYTFINIFATPNKWLDFSDVELIMAEITVKVRINVDIT